MIRSRDLKPSVGKESDLRRSVSLTLPGGWQFLKQQLTYVAYMHHMVFSLLPLLANVLPTSLHVHMCDFHIDVENTSTK